MDKIIYCDVKDYIMPELDPNLKCNDYGDYKGSAIAMMIELLAAGLVGDLFSFEAQKVDNNDGGPARGGEFIMSFSPELIAGENWNEHAEKFFKELS